MIRRVIRSPVACLMLVITAILSVGYSSCAHAPASWSARQTPHLVFSTYLGGSIACYAGGASPITFAQNAACDAQGNTYVTGATQVSDLPVLNAYQPSPGARQHDVGVRGEVQPCRPTALVHLPGWQQSKHGHRGGCHAERRRGGRRPYHFGCLGTVPHHLNAFQAQNNGQSDYFVTVFDANGNLQYSTYLGGSGVEGAVGEPGNHLCR